MSDFKTWSVYDPATGLFTGRRVSGGPTTPSTLPKHLSVIEGRHDLHTQRVDVTTGDVVAYERPAAEVDAERQAALAQQALRRIDELERAQLRPMRELAIDPNNAEAKRRLEEIETAIAGLRGELPQTKTPAGAGV